MCSAGVWAEIEAGNWLDCVDGWPLIEMGANTIGWNWGKWWVGGVEVDQIKWKLAVHKLQANEGVGKIFSTMIWSTTRRPPPNTAAPPKHVTPPQGWEPNFPTVQPPPSHHISPSNTNPNPASFCSAIPANIFPNSALTLSHQNQINCAQKPQRLRTPPPPQETTSTTFIWRAMNPTPTPNANPPSLQNVTTTIQNSTHSQSHHTPPPLRIPRHYTLPPLWHPRAPAPSSSKAHTRTPAPLKRPLQVNQCTINAVPSPKMPHPAARPQTLHHPTSPPHQLRSHPSPPPPARPGLQALAHVSSPPAPRAQSLDTTQTTADPSTSANRHQGSVHILYNAYGVGGGF